MDNQEDQNIKDALATFNKFKIENILGDIAEDIHNTLPNGQKRFAKFEVEFKKRFPGGTAVGAAAEVLTWGLLDVPLALYFLGQSSAVFVELHGFLERFVLRDLPFSLAKDKQAAAIITSIIERKTRSELADILLKLRIWNGEDVRFAINLANIRNGIVHKNAKLVSKYLSAGKDVHISDIDSLTRKSDCVHFIIRTIELLVKLSSVVARTESKLTESME
jgi:hypothetical protein